MRRYAVEISVDGTVSGVERFWRRSSALSWARGFAGGILLRNRLIREHPEIAKWYSARELTGMAVKVRGPEGEIGRWVW